MSSYSEFLERHPDWKILKGRPILGMERELLTDLGVFENDRQTRPLQRNDLMIVLEANSGPDYLDFSGMDMTGIDLRGIDLSRSNLRGCNLERAIAIPMIARHGKEWTPGDMGYGPTLETWSQGAVRPDDAEVTPTRLNGSILSWANISKADFRWSNLTDSYLQRCNLSGASLSFADLSKADLSWARLQEAELTHVVLEGACLTGSRIIDADLSQASLEDADLAGAFISPLTNMSGVKWDAKYICRAERLGDYDKARAIYRMLKEWHDRAGFRRLAGEFHYREMEAAGKADWHSLQNNFKEDWNGLKLAWKRIFKSTTKDQ